LADTRLPPRLLFFFVAVNHGHGQASESNVAIHDR
jgi:hypothetical protein